jgi:hypothetical protein
MTWTRLDDGFTDRQIFEDLTYEARWHYLAMVSFCSRTNRYDGFIRGADARRCSDVPDPAKALVQLANHGIVAPVDGGYVLPLIDEHVPPPHLRDEKRKQDQRDRKRRERQHRKGDHTYCSHDPEGDTSRVTSPVTSGRDGTGRDGGSITTTEVEADEAAEALADYRPGRVRGADIHLSTEEVA